MTQLAFLLYVLPSVRYRLMNNSKSETRLWLNRDGIQGFYTRPAQWLYNAKWRKQHRLTGAKQLKFCYRFFFHSLFFFCFRPFAN